MPQGPQTYDDDVGEAFIEFMIVFGPVLIVYAMSIVYAGKLALARGRSRTKWTFRTVLFGPLAILALLVLPSRKREVEYRSKHRRQR